MKTYILRDPKAVEPQKRKENPLPKPRLGRARAGPPPGCPGCGQPMVLIGQLARKPPCESGGCELKVER